MPSERRTLEQLIARGGSRDYFRPGYSYRGLDYPMIEVEDCTGGMITALPRQRIPANSFRVVRNGRCRDYWVGRREGTTTFLSPPGGLSGDDRRVLRIMVFHQEDDQIFLVVFRPTSMQFTTSNAGWVSVTGGSFHADTSARPQGAALLGKLYVVNHENRVHELNFSSAKLTELETSPRGKFITAFAERIIVGNLREFVGGIRPSKIRWCAPFQADEWDDIDAGAGEEDLVTSPSDTGDDITGLFGFEREMIILRERSIWHVTRQPFAIAPFRITPFIAEFGCDLPYTAVRVEGGLMFADVRTNGVYYYRPGTLPQRISDRIRNELFDGISSAKWAEATYDPVKREYHLGITTTGTYIDKVWVFNLDTGAWTYDDTPEVTALGTSENYVNTTTIDELTGKIDALVGVIDDLSSPGYSTPIVFKGTSTGEVIYHDPTSDEDWDTDAYEFELRSHNLGGNSRQRTLHGVQWRVDCPSLAGAVSVDNSADESTWNGTKSKSLAAGSFTDVGLHYSQLYASRIYWRMRATTGDPRVLAWWARFVDTGLKPQT